MTRTAAAGAALLLVPRLPTRLNTGADAAAGLFTNTAELHPVEGPHSTRRFVITEKVPTRAFSWLKAPIDAFTFNIY